MMKISPQVYTSNNISYEAIFIHILLLYLFLFPIIRTGNKLNISNLEISDRIFLQVSIFLIICGGLGILLSIRDILTVLSYDTIEVARQTILADGGLGLYKYGILGYVGTIGMISPPFALFLAFYRLFIRKKPDFILYLLLFTSLSGICINLTIAGRDGIVRWIMFLISTFVIYKPYITLKLIPKFILLITIIVIIFIITIFAVVTISRFGEGESALLSLVSYFGQSFYYFSSLYDGVGNKSLFGFASIFPIIPGGKSSLEVAMLTNNFSFRTDVFSTFIGSFVLYVGVIRTFLLAVAFDILYLYFNTKCNNRLHSFFSFLIFFQVVYIGIFYFVFNMLAWQMSFIIIYLFSKYRIAFKSHRINLSKHSL